jgi:hypothetical protein
MKADAGLMIKGDEEEEDGDWRWMQPDSSTQREVIEKALAQLATASVAMRKQ